MILIVDDEHYIRSSLSGLLQDEGYDAAAVESAEKAEIALEKEPVELILLDIQMPGKDGLTFLDDNKSRLREIPVIIISGKGDIPTAVAAMKLGGYDYIEKPLVPERVLVTVAQALRLSRSLRSEKKLVGHILDRYEIVGRSREIEQLRRLIDKAAAVDSPILITGENGSGKELVAYNIHYLSNRKTEPMVAVNCPAIPGPLFESELFGHVRGAFTGAANDRTGRVEAAEGGTLFLDEIGDLPPELQGKLLRVLESGQYEKIGSDQTVTADCRLLAATNRDLAAMTAGGTFREDLFYRINVVSIHSPTLRSRAGDIPLLVDHFLRKENADGKYEFSSEAIGVMAAFDWPGNVRQLRNVVRQVIFNCEPGSVSAAEIERILHPRNAGGSADNAEGENRLTAAVRQFEIGFLSRLHRKHDGNIAAMARELGMDRGNLSRKLKQLGIV